MYIMDQFHKMTVNSTTLSSIQIQEIFFADSELKEAFPKPYRIMGYGKGDKEYVLGTYADVVEATRELEGLHKAMENKEKTYELRDSYKINSYFWEKNNSFDF